MKHAPPHTCYHVEFGRCRENLSLFYANALIDIENEFLKFLQTHVDNVRKRTEKVYENAQN